MSRTFEQNAGRSCKIEYRSASLSESFGLELFKRKAGKHADRILAELGTYSKGKRQGKPRGFIHWIKVVEGGYDYYTGRGVLRKGSMDYRVTKEYGSEHHLCEYVLDFDKQKAELVKSIEEMETSLKEELVAQPIREMRLERDLSDENLKSQGDDWYKECVEYSTKEVELGKERISRLNERIEKAKLNLSNLSNGNPPVT